MAWILLSGLSLFDAEPLQELAETLRVPRWLLHPGRGRRPGLPGVQVDLDVSVGVRLRGCGLLLGRRVAAFEEDLHETGQLRGRGGLTLVKHPLEIPVHLRRVLVALLGVLDEG